MRDQGSNEDEVDKILRAIAGVVGEVADGSLPAPDDERLRAYREGRLSPEETREMEVLLAGSDAGRRRLLELAGIDRSLPLRRVRKAVLGQERRRTTTSMSVAAIAAMAAGIVLALAAILSQSRALPEGLTYEVSARGLAEVRSADEVPGQVPGELRAYPATTLRILLRPQGEVSAGISFALYRREGAALRRVREPEEVRLASDRGSATFSGTASRMLATGAPGVYSLFALVSAEEDLPSTVEIEPGQDPARSLQSSGRLVYPVTVTLLPKEVTP